MKRITTYLCRSFLILGTILMMVACQNESTSEQNTDVVEQETSAQPSEPAGQKKFDESEFITKEFALMRFFDLSVEVPAHLTLEYASRQKVTVTGPPNVAEELRMEIEKGKIRFFASTSFKSMYSLDITVQTPMLNSVFALYDGDVTIDGRIFNGEDATLVTRGNNTVTVKDLDRPHFAVLLNGQGKTTVSGKSVNFSCYLNGEGDIDANALQTSHVRGKISGKGNVYVAPTSSLNVQINGEGNFYYKNSPSVSQEITGTGKVIQQ